MNYWKHIDDFFREKLGRYRETPPPDVWEALDKQLDGLIPSPTTPAGPKPSFRWLGHVTMVSLVAALSIPLVRKMYTGNTQHVNSAPVEALVKPGTTSPVVAEANAMAKNDHTATAENTRVNASSSIPAQTDKPIADASVAQAAETFGNSKVQKAKTAGLKNRKQDMRITKKQTRITTANAGRKTNNDRDRQGAKPDKYNSSVAGATNNVPTDEKETTSAKLNQPATKATRKDNTKKSVAKKAEAARPLPAFSRLEAGLKAGYERGFNNDAAVKYTVSPYLQYNLSSKIGLMFQPTVKYAQLKTGSVGSSQSYYKVNQDGTAKLDSSIQTGAVGGTKTYLNYYTYSQSHDSIVKSYMKGGSWLEFEIPVLLKYKITKNLSAYGGVNFLYHKVGIAENTYAKQGIVKSTGFTENTIGLPTGSPTGAGIDYSYSGMPVADYKDPYPTPKNILNAGYMLGFSYEYSSMWLFDALMEQSPASKNVESGYNVNAPVSAPYFRLSVGYKFIK